MKNKTKNRNTENAQAVYERASRVINADKSAMSEECRAVALRDFLHVAREYFDLKGLPSLEIVNKSGEYDISVRFKADRVKTFYLLK
ncbi:MAG: hypothetical protein IJY26_03130 [Clostridia bacterium]|nr:hypothetical protein [Clostridia bacterium]